jgi:hypothetical protein
METLERLFFVLIGLGGILYAFLFYRFNFNPLVLFPGPLRERKLAFSAGFLVMLIGFVLSWFIGRHHEVISLFGAWGMLLGSSYWFHQRYLRQAFAPSEWKIIRITLFSGIVVTLLSTGFFFLPKFFSPGLFLMGIAIMYIPGRLWWRSTSDI